jgi:hypothetical protein
VCSFPLLLISGCIYYVCCICCDIPGSNDWNLCLMHLSETATRSHEALISVQGWIKDGTQKSGVFEFGYFMTQIQPPRWFIFWPLFFLLLWKSILVLWGKNECLC